VPGEPCEARREDTTVPLIVSEKRWTFEKSTAEKKDKIVIFLRMYERVLTLRFLVF